MTTSRDALDSRAATAEGEPDGGTLVPVASIITDEVREVEAVVDNGRLLLDPDRLPDALGWQLKPEGLCRDGVCVPVRDRSTLTVGTRLDLEAVAGALGRPAVVDADAGVAAIALPAEERRRALDGLQAPQFTLPDLDGRAHTLEEWRGRKKLLVAFATW
jgi:hypothetical protein